MVRYSITEGKIIDSVKNISPNPLVCFRHWFRPKTGNCRLCNAKLAAKGNFELARLIYVGKTERF